MRIVDVTGIARGGGFEQENGGFRDGAGAVFDAARDDVELAGVEDDDVVAELEPHLPAPDKEHLIGVLVAVPRELAEEFDELYFLAVESGDDLGPPVLMNLAEFFVEGRGWHK
jgi:hypothetical protein